MTFRRLQATKKKKKQQQQKMLQELKITVMYHHFGQLIAISNTCLTQGSYFASNLVLPSLEKKKKRRQLNKQLHATVIKQYDRSITGSRSFIMVSKDVLFYRDIVHTLFSSVESIYAFSRGD